VWSIVGGFFLDLSGPPPMSTSTAVASKWVSGNEAKRIVGWNWYRLHREALVGNIRSVIEPAGLIRFHRADLERIAQERATRGC
jgi:hypothetical protein